MNDRIFYTVKRLYKKRWIIKNNKEVEYYPKIPNKKDLVFKLIDNLQEQLKDKNIHIIEEDKLINRVAPSGQKSHHKKMIPIYRGYKKTYLKQKQSIEEGIKILKEIFKKEYN